MMESDKNLEIRHLVAEAKSMLTSPNTIPPSFPIQTQSLHQMRFSCTALPTPSRITRTSSNLGPRTIDSHYLPSTAIHQRSNSFEIRQEPQLRNAYEKLEENSPSRISTPKTRRRSSLGNQEPLNQDHIERIYQPHILAERYLCPSCFVIPSGHFHSLDEYQTTVLLIT